MASNEPTPLASISNGSKCVLAPHIGLSSSTVSIMNTTIELTYTIKRPAFGFLNNTAVTNARLIRYAAMKFGKQPVKLLRKFVSLKAGLSTSLLRVIKPNKAANKETLIKKRLILLFKLIISQDLNSGSVGFNLSRCKP